MDHYDRLCDALLAQGITPMVTLYHWDLPSELQAEGGWLNPRTGELFGQYADAMATRLGDRVGAWATLNEPWCSAFLGYAAGVHAPGRQAPAEALEVAYRLLVAHARGLEGLRAGGAQQCGIVLNMMPTFPDDAYRDDPVVARAARHIDGLQNDLWLDALAGRGLNADVVAGTAEITDWAFVGSAELAGIAAPLDWLGVNYYTVQRLAAVEATADRAVGQGAEAHPGCPPVRFAPRDPLTTMGWEVNPDGLGAILRHTASALPGVPLWVAENGMALPDLVVDGQCDDPRRVDYLQRHLDQVVAVRSRGRGHPRVPGVVVVRQHRVGGGLAAALRSRPRRSADPGTHAQGQRALAARPAGRAPRSGRHTGPHRPGSGPARRAHRTLASARIGPHLEAEQARLSPYCQACSSTAHMPRPRSPPFALTSGG